MGFLDHVNPANDGLLPKVSEAVEYGLASYGYGYVQNRWRDKAHLASVPADLLLGGAFKALAIGADLWASKRGFVGKAAPFVNVFGNTGIGAFFHTLGAGHGAQASGVKRLLLKTDAQVKKARAALPDAEIVGEIPKAPHGDFLSSAELSTLR